MPRPPDFISTLLGKVNVSDPFGSFGSAFGSGRGGRAPAPTGDDWQLR